MEVGTRRRNGVAGNQSRVGRGGKRVRERSEGIKSPKRKQFGWNPKKHMIT